MRLLAHRNSGAANFDVFDFPVSSETAKRAKKYDVRSESSYLVLEWNDFSTSEARALEKFVLRNQDTDSEYFETIS